MGREDGGKLANDEVPPYKERKIGEGPTVDVRLLIASKDAGAVIGKGGEVIKRLRADYDASVQLPDSPGPERIVSISASIGSATQIVQTILPNLGERARGREAPIPTDEPIEIRVLIHQSQAGAIIGMAGSRIKELRKQTGCNIKVFSECCPGSTDRVVVLSGMPDEIVMCLSIVLDMLQEAPPKGPVQAYNPSIPGDDFFADKYGGYQGGGSRRGGREDRFGGGGGREQRFPGGAAGGGGGGRFDDRRDRGGERGYRGGADRGMGGGAPFGGGAGRYDAQPPMGGGGGNFELGAMDESGVRSLMPPRGGDMGGAFGEPRTSNKVSIPKDLTGAIIGKGGMRIKQIRQESGAQIQIDEALPGSNDRIITITGTRDQIQNAQYLLQLSVKQSLANKY